MAKQKFLIVAPVWIGDIMVSQALYKTLFKKTNGNIQIDVMTSGYAAPLLKFMPEISQVISTPFQHGKLHLIKRFLLARKIRKQGYDTAIILRKSFKSALIPFLAKIPQRIGYQTEARRLLLTDARPLDKLQTPLLVNQYINLSCKQSQPLQLKDDLYPRLTILNHLRGQIRKKFNLSKINRPILALCPGAAYGEAKQWPAIHFITLAQQKIKEGWSIWLFGAPFDTKIAVTIAAALPSTQCHNFVGHTTLEEAIILLSEVDIVVTNDSGLLHISAALDKPTVVVYGASSMTCSPPLSGKIEKLFLDIPCRPCLKRTCPLGHGDCLKKLYPKYVLDRLQRLEQLIL